jgi:hypothetical protein
MVHICHPSYTGSVNWRITVQAGLNINRRLYLKNTQSKNGWGHGSSGRALHSKHKAPGSNPSTTKTNKRKMVIVDHRRQGKQRPSRKRN